MTLRVRVDLTHVRPPLWRRLELASDLPLPAMHEVLQAAMGWSDSRLHRFALGGRVFDRDVEEFPTALDVEEGDDGTPDADARLDEVLVDVGDQLHHAYDFGDGWEHVIRVETVLPRADDAPGAACTAGRRACPPEDCGGPGGYTDLLDALADPDASDVPDVQERLAWAEDLRPDHFDVAEADAAVRAAATPTPDVEEPAPRVAELLRRAVGPGRRELSMLVADAHLAEATPRDAEVTAALALPHTRLLDLVGADGIGLSAAGYLPPAVVTELLGVVDPHREWIGAGDRESLTAPVLAFREGAQQLGLVRKVKGRLVLTPRGRALRPDAAGLLTHLAERLPLGRAAHERDAETLVLLVVAAGHDPSGAVAPLLVRALRSSGWSGSDGGEVDARVLRRAAEGTIEVLGAVGALGSRAGLSGAVPVTPAWRVFVRMALSS